MKSAVIQHVSAVTFAVVEMARSVGFYEALGFSIFFGGPDAKFTTMRSEEAYVNLVLTQGYEKKRWGRVIFRVDDVDPLYALVKAANLSPSTRPRDADWGERYFHITDPDGHELSFAQLLV